MGPLRFGRFRVCHEPLARIQGELDRDWTGQDRLGMITFDEFEQASGQSFISNQ